MRIVSTMILTAALTLAALPSLARPGLPNETEINNGLLIAAVVEKIQRECDTLGARFLKGRAYLTSLKEMASDRGYSDAEIEAYINDDAEKARMRQRRNDYFKKHGASNLDPDSLCVLGHAEIARKSQIGLLLRAK